MQKHVYPTTVQHHDTRSFQAAISRIEVCDVTNLELLEDV